MAELAIELSGRPAATVGITLESDDARVQNVLPQDAQLTLEQLDVFIRERDRLRELRGAEFDERSAKLGRELFAALVGAGGEQQLIVARSEARARGDRLRMTLQLHRSDPRWATLPWELMQFERGGQTVYLARDPNLSFARLWVSNANAERGRPAPNEALEVLLVYAAMQDGEQGLKPPQIKTLEPTLTALHEAGTIALTRLDQPTEKTLRAALERRWHIVHFIGHGSVRAGESDEPVVAIADDAGYVHWLSASKFVYAVSQRLPQLLLLQACESAAGTGDRVASSLAERLMALDVPAVIAMQFEIDNGRAQDFVAKLYGQIAARRPLDVATQTARYELADQRGATPVLYLCPGGQDALLPAAVAPVADGLPAAVLHSTRELQRGSKRLQIYKEAHFAVQAVQQELGRLKRKIECEELEDGPIAVMRLHVDQIRGQLGGAAEGATLTELERRLASLELAAQHLIENTTNPEELLLVSPARVKSFERTLIALSGEINGALRSTVNELPVEAWTRALDQLDGPRRRSLESEAARLAALHQSFRANMQLHDLLQEFERSAMAWHDASLQSIDEILLILEDDDLLDKHRELAQRVPSMQREFVSSMGRLEQAARAGDAKLTLRRLTKLFNVTLSIFSALDRTMLDTCRDIIACVTGLAALLLGTHPDPRADHG